VWDEVRFEVLHPRADDYAAPGKPNTMSCVLRISSQVTSGGPPSRVALLAGDLESAQEARLVLAGAPLKADVLLVPHHGSKTSSSAAFLDAVQPHVALVQAGYRNRFGHPVASVMDRYRARGIQIVSSPSCGAATWRSDRSGDVPCQRELAARYWQHHLPLMAQTLLEPMEAR
jgi:competence protein ComEC